MNKRGPIDLIAPNVGPEISYFDTVTLLKYVIHDFDPYVYPQAAGGFYRRLEPALKKGNAFCI
jgi:hypothetical protein